MVYAVIDTNVLVSALFAVHPDSATVLVRDKIVEGDIVPIYNVEIFEEYRSVLSRPKFHFPDALVDAVLDMLLLKGLHWAGLNPTGNSQTRRTWYFMRWLCLRMELIS